MISAPQKAPDDSPLETEILELAAHIDAAMHRFLTLVRRFDANGDWAGVGLKSCAHWLSWRCGLSLGAARERVRVARALGELPAIDEALSKGLLSYSKVRAMTRVASPENEAKLLHTAKATTAAQLERVCRGVAVCQRQEGSDEQQPVGEDERWVRLKRGDGDLVRVEAQLHADEAALLMQAIDEVRRRASEALAPDPEGERPRFGRADALVRAADVLLAGGAAAGVGAGVGDESGDAGQVGEVGDAGDDEDVGDAARADVRVAPGPARTGGDRATVFVHLKREALSGEVTAELEDGTHVPAGTFRRIACDAGLVPVVMDGQGHPLDVGRKTRAISPAQRRALMLRDRSCTFPGCECTRFVDAHHVEHWQHGGETKLGNLVLLCPFHHRAVHEGGFAVRLGEDQVPRFFRPDGRELAAPPRYPLAPAEAVAALRAGNEKAGAHIDARTGESGWRGERPDYGYMVARLV